MEHKPIYPEIRPESVAIPKGQSLSSWLNSRIARYETRAARLGRAQVSGRLRPEISPRADALHRHRRHRRRGRRQHGAGRALHFLDHGAAGRMRGAVASAHRRRGGVLRAARQQAALHHRAPGRALRDHAQGARPVLGSARRLSRPGQRGHRGSADVRHHRQQQAGDADLSARSPGRQDQAPERAAAARSPDDASARSGGPSSGRPKSRDSASLHAGSTSSELRGP